MTITQAALDFVEARERYLELLDISIEQATGSGSIPVVSDGDLEKAKTKELDAYKRLKKLLNI